MAEAPFAILTVCTGNICRSPAAERLLAARLGDDVQVSSAGVGAVVGHPIQRQMVSQLNRVGVDSTAFAARQLRASEVRSAGLILALTREHRGQVVELVPAALRRTFTLLEFARILDSAQLPGVPAAAPDQWWPQLVNTAARHRQLGEAVNDDDVPDPYRLPDEVYARSFALIDHATATIARAVLGRLS